MSKAKTEYTTIQVSRLMKERFPGVKGFTRQNIIMNIRLGKLDARRDENTNIYLISAEQVKKMIDAQK